MTPSTDLAAFRRLPLDERIRLVGDLWDAIATDSPDEAFPVTPALARELDRRIAAVREGRDPLIAWDEVKARILDGRIPEP
jgi:putative addiction module component (TIGR02574 family)